MEPRVALLKAYTRGWDSWDSDLLVSALAPGFTFDDPAWPEPVTADNMPAYMASWKERVQALGGTGEIGSRDRVHLDQDGAFISWHWWSFVGTPFEGAAVTRATDDGVQYERITYREPRGVASCLRNEKGLVVDDTQAPWCAWDAGSTEGTVLHYRTFFAAEETATTGVIQGILEYPPKARSMPHWHTPVETYHVLSGSGTGHIGGREFQFGPGAAVYVPSRAVHWFENVGAEPLRVFWTLACDAIDDVDFTFVE